MRFQVAASRNKTKILPVSTTERMLGVLKTSKGRGKGALCTVPLESARCTMVILSFWTMVHGHWYRRMLNRGENIRFHRQDPDCTPENYFFSNNGIPAYFILRNEKIQARLHM